MTNWFTRNGKVLISNGKIRGCCCEETADCSISYRVSPYGIIYLGPFLTLKQIATFVSYNGVYPTTPPFVAENTSGPAMEGYIMIRCDGGVPHVWYHLNNIYTTDLGEAPATGSLQYQFVDDGNTMTVTVTAL